MADRGLEKIFIAFFTSALLVLVVFGVYQISMLVQWYHIAGLMCIPSAFVVRIAWKLFVSNKYALSLQGDRDREASPRSELEQIERQISNQILAMSV